MILSYFFRLVCVGVASFFLADLVAGLAMSFGTNAAVRIAHRMRPSLAARFLLGLRLLPVGFAFLVVAGLCVPSYLRLEPEAATEHVGLGFLAVALLSLAIWGSSIMRGLRAGARSRAYIRECQGVGREVHVAGECSPIWVIEGACPLVALAGVICPRLVISRKVVDTLSPDQLAAALRHDNAHRVTRGNLKRLSLLLAPGILPLVGGYAALERGWPTFPDWQAHVRALSADVPRPLSLAAALVRVSRLGAAAGQAPLVTSLMGDSRDLAERVDRLLTEVTPGEQRGRGMFLIMS